MVKKGNDDSLIFADDFETSELNDIIALLGSHKNIFLVSSTADRSLSFDLKNLKRAAKALNVLIVPTGFENPSQYVFGRITELHRTGPLGFQFEEIESRLAGDHSGKHVF